MAWTKGQQIVVAMLPKFSSILSLFGSIWIMIEVVTDDTPGRPKRNHPYHRLLFAMSLYDVLESVWNFASSWPIPEGTENIAWTTGTTATCSAQGFFLQFSVAVPIYNAMLSFYYVLVIKYKFKDETLRKWVEPTMHVVAFVWAFGTAFYAAVAGYMNNANLWCWIAPFPAGCNQSFRGKDEATCTRGDNSDIIRWIFYFAPLWLCIFSATVFTIVVYLYVRSIDKTSALYRNPEKRFSYLNTQVPATGTTGSGKSVTFTENSREHAMSDEGEKNEKNRTTSSVQGRERRREGNDDSDDDENENDDDGDDSGSEVGMPAIPEQTPLDTSDRRLHQHSSYHQSGSQDGSSRGSLVSQSQRSSRASVRNLVDKWKSSRQQFRSDYKRTLEVYHQALYYVGTFYLTHVWSTTNRIYQLVTKGQSIFALTAIHSFFDPLQGFLNYLVYQRPRYLRIRKHYPKAGRIGALIRMLRFSYMKDPVEWGDRESTRFGSHRGRSSGYRASSESKDASEKFRSSMEFKMEASAVAADSGPAIGARMTFAGMEQVQEEQLTEQQ